MQGGFLHYLKFVGEKGFEKTIKNNISYPKLEYKAERWAYFMRAFLHLWKGM